MRGVGRLEAIGEWLLYSVTSLSLDTIITLFIDDSSHEAVLS